MAVSTSYLHNIFDSPESYSQTIKGVCDLIGKIQEANGEFDCIACRGVSGILIAAPVAATLEKSLLVVRKDSEMNYKISHAQCQVEGMPYFDHPLSFLIIDDLMSTGKTANEIIKLIQLENPKATPSGILMYHNSPRFFKLTEQHEVSSLYPWQPFWNSKISP